MGNAALLLLFLRNKNWFWRVLLGMEYQNCLVQLQEPVLRSGNDAFTTLSYSVLDRVYGGLRLKAISRYLTSPFHRSFLLLVTCDICLTHNPLQKVL